MRLLAGFSTWSILDQPACPEEIGPFQVHDFHRFETLDKAVEIFVMYSQHVVYHAYRGY